MQNNSVRHGNQSDYGICTRGSLSAERKLGENAERSRDERFEGKRKKNKGNEKATA